MRLHWNQIVSNAVTVLVAAVFVGAATQLWHGVSTIDSRIDSNLSHIRDTQEVLTPKVDEIEQKLVQPGWSLLTTERLNQCSDR